MRGVRLLAIIEKNNVQIYEYYHVGKHLIIGIIVS